MKKVQKPGMTASAITIETVRDAIAAILAANRKVTIRAVRARIGSGSFNTIGKLMKQLGFGGKNSQEISFSNMGKMCDIAKGNHDKTTILASIAMENSRLDSLETLISEMESGFRASIRSAREEMQTIRKRIDALSSLL